MELRQLRYFVTLAEELHFGRAAAREHIVQSALSARIKQLERELGVRLLERSTHHVSLTAAGAVFLPEARQILDRVERARAAARGIPVRLRAGILDANHDSMPQILHHLQARHPDLVVDQIEAGVPEQYRLLAGGRLDVGIGAATHAPPQIASRLVRQDPVGLLLPEGHRLAARQAVPVALLAREPLLMATASQAPEFNQVIAGMCRDAGVIPTLYEGTVQSVRGAAGLVARGRCLYAVPMSCALALPATTWRPLVEPAHLYPWSILWRADDQSPHLKAVVDCARILARALGWLRTGDRVAA
ncbi:LysR family transcriptional regulator [Sphaerisporangium corydalis]|uniref:LysR family transcriptional regulator n=1 Tax=Sphaerisporangium corydalis TaxID=1441875 RepID=A0ABV9EPC2_9ACTN|nr:LysR substrate-binding domain-containing protein [Sphaerisporangium corydalis]